MTGQRQSHELLRKLALGHMQSPPQNVRSERAGREDVEDRVSGRFDRGWTP